MASPKWNGGVGTAASFGREGRTITPGASDLDPIAKAVVMLATGDITVVPSGNADATTIRIHWVTGRLHHPVHRSSRDGVLQFVRCHRRVT